MDNLVFVHGFLGSALNWGPVIHRLEQDPELKNKWKFHALEMLGHGFRAANPSLPQLTLREVADDLLAQAPQGPFVALGHSFGLRPLLRIAAMHPDRLRALIVEDASPVMSRQGESELKKILLGCPVPFSSREAAKNFFDSNFGMGTPMSRFLLSNIREKAPGEHRWRFDAEALKHLLSEAQEHPLWQEWENFAGPIYMILGESGHVSAERARECELQRLSKLTKITTISQSAHWVHSEQLGQFTKEVSRILKDIG